LHSTTNLADGEERRFAPKAKRARILASVFFMQACGILAASVVSVVVVAAVQAQNPDMIPRAVDHIWRWMMGLSLIPATFAVVIRLSIPESPRYTLDVLDDPYKAFEEANRFNESNLREEFDLQANLALVKAFPRPRTPDSENNGSQLPGAPESQTERNQPFLESDETPPKYTVKDYFWKQGNWRFLLGTALTWFLLDFAFFGLGLSSPKAISRIWYNGVHSPSANPPTWDVTYFKSSNPDAVIFDILTTSAWHSLVVVSVGAVIGSMALIVAIDHFNRKRLQWTMFIVLGFLFIITGGTYRIGNNGVTITLYIFCQICFYFGPNGLTFIIPAELFPTKYRTTCHGLSAASGKLGSIIVQIFLAYAKFGPSGSKTTWLSPDSPWFGDVLLIFSAPMFLGAIVSWWFIPDLQDKDGQSLSLELLAEGRERQNSGYDRTDV
jgi:MFS transporter, PHS family, inorganic phosphate transporter